MLYQSHRNQFQTISQDFQKSGIYSRKTKKESPGKRRSEKLSETNSKSRR